jgi:putative colanic acid biosysnthesis UDP-glucose lipid carrier transferase
MPTVRSQDLDAGMFADTLETRTSWSVHGRALTRLLVKHPVDRLAALALLLVTAPLLVAVAIAVRIREDGPVLRRDERLGEDGRTIGVLSFWITDGMCESPAWQLLDRTGVTALPQLWNVLCGELSLVGPRPRPLALTPPPARPGLTGLAQVEQLARQIPLAERYALDARYADSWSLLLDLRIVARTMWRTVRRA